MQYLLLIYEKEARFHEMEHADFATELGEYQTFGKEFGPAIKGGNALQPTSTAKTLQVRDGKEVIVDGPFAETKEQLGGYYLVDAGSIEEAIHMAAKIPGARYGSIEVRPIMTFS